MGDSGHHHDDEEFHDAEEGGGGEVMSVRVRVQVQEEVEKECVIENKKRGEGGLGEKRLECVTILISLRDERERLTECVYDDFGSVYVCMYVCAARNAALQFENAEWGVRRHVEN